MPGSDQSVHVAVGSGPPAVVHTSLPTRQVPWWLAWLLAAAHAALFVAAFPPLNLWPLIVLAPVPLVVLACTARNLRSTLPVVLFVQTAMWLWISSWLWQVTAPGFVPYALIMASWAVLFVWLMSLARRHRRLVRLPAAVIVPVLWVGIEFLRGEIFFDGYPWFLLGHPLVEWPIAAQSADLLGTYFLSFLVAMVAGGIVDVVLPPFAHVRSARRLASVPVVVGVMAVVIVGHLAYGFWRVNQQSPLLPGPSLLVIQTNLPQDNKMRSTPEEHWDFFQRFMALTVDAYDTAVQAGEDVDLIIWPETMVTGWGFEPSTVNFFLERDYWPGYRFAMATEVAATELSVPMLVGSPAVLGVKIVDEHELDWDSQHNSAYLVEPAADPALLGRTVHQRYDKVFLTPFGETMPYIRAWPWLQEKMLSVGARGMQFNLEPGESPRVLELDWGGRRIGLATPICFEATMGSVCRDLVYASGSEKRADVMINLSNDGWFGQYVPGRIQHAQIARLRAIENRVPMVRSANTGMSISIDSVGRIIAAVGQGRYGQAQQPGSLLTEVQLDSRQTLFSKVGQVWGWACLTLAGLGMLFVFSTKKEERA